MRAEPDGSIIVAGTYRSEILLANSVLRCGAAVELLEPASVRKLIAQEVSSLARVYQEND